MIDQIWSRQSKWFEDLILITFVNLSYSGIRSNFTQETVDDSTTCSNRIGVLF